MRLRSTTVDLNEQSNDRKPFFFACVDEVCSDNQITLGQRVPGRLILEPRALISLKPNSRPAALHFSQCPPPPTPLMNIQE